MIAEQEVHRAASLPHGDALPIGVVVARHCRCVAPPFQVVAHVISGHAAQRGFDAVAIAIVDETRARGPADADQPILLVVGEVRYRAADGAPHLIAVGIVAVGRGLAVDRSAHRRVGAAQRSAGTGVALRIIALQLINFSS